MDPNPALASLAVLLALLVTAYVRTRHVSWLRSLAFLLILIGLVRGWRRRSE